MCCCGGLRVVELLHQSFSGVLIAMRSSAHVSDSAYLFMKKVNVSAVRKNTQLARHMSASHPAKFKILPKLCLHARVQG